MQRVAKLIIASSVLFVGCSETGDNEVAGPRASVVSTPVSPRPFSAYGVPVTEQEITAIPEPYNPRKHGPAFRRNSHPENLARLLRIERPVPRHVQRGQGIPNNEPDPFPGTGDGGRDISASSSSGIYAMNDVNRNMNMPRPPDGTSYYHTIYAPTHLPAKRSCIEAVTVHRRKNDMSTTGDYHGFWNHCVAGQQGFGEFQYLGDMDDAPWQSRYMRTYDGEERYFVQVQAMDPEFLNGCWEGFLYNFNVGVWELISTFCGTAGPHIPSDGHGWTMWESWNMPDCRAYPSIRANNIMLQRSDWSWSLFVLADQWNIVQRGCFSTGAYTFHLHAENYDWHAHTPDGTG